MALIGEVLIRVIHDQPSSCLLTHVSGSLQLSFTQQYACSSPQVVIDSLMPHVDRTINVAIP